MFSLQAVNSFLRVQLLPQLLTRSSSKLIWMSRSRAATEHRYPQMRHASQFTQSDPKPCFDIDSVHVAKCNKSHIDTIRSFLYTHYWPREPSTVSMYVPITSPYLAALTEKYATSGDRWLAFERADSRSNECRAVGVMIAEKMFPWAADEYNDWAMNCCLKQERHNMFFRSFWIQSSNVFDAYHVPFAYNIEALATASDAVRQGVATLLLRTAILHCMSSRYPLMQVLSKSEYSHKLCEKVGMKRVWEMDYKDFVDRRGQCMFYPRRPHKTVALYIRRFSSKDGLMPEEWKDPELFAVFKKQSLDKELICPVKKRCDTNFPMFPKCKK